MHVRSWWNRVERCFADRHVAISEQTLFDSVLGRLLSDGFGAKHDTLYAQRHFIYSWIKRRRLVVCNDLLVRAPLSWCVQQCLGVRSNVLVRAPHLLVWAQICWRVQQFVGVSIYWCVQQFLDVYASAYCRVQ